MILKKKASLPKGQHPNEERDSLGTGRPWTCPAAAPSPRGQSRWSAGVRLHTPMRQAGPHVPLGHVGLWHAAPISKCGRPCRLTLVRVGSCGATQASAWGVGLKPVPGALSAGAVPRVQGMLLLGGSCLTKGPRRNKSSPQPLMVLLRGVFSSNPPAVGF